MGQYWQFINLDKKQMIGTHELGTGLKYLEQFFESGFPFRLGWSS